MKNVALLAGFNTIWWWFAIVAYFFGPPCIIDRNRNVNLPLVRPQDKSAATKISVEPQWTAAWTTRVEKWRNAVAGGVATAMGLYCIGGARTTGRFFEV